MLNDEEVIIKFMKKTYHMFYRFFVLMICGIFLVFFGCFLRAKFFSNYFYSSKANRVCLKNMPINFKNDFIGIWFSFIDWEKCCDFSSEEAFVENLNKNIIPNLKKLRINNIMLHAVSHGDAFYFSKIYPMSKLIKNKIGYDPYEIFVKLLKENEIKVHAWINPLRAMTDKEFEDIDSSYETKKLYISKNKSDYYLKDKKGRYWLNPSNPRVVKLIEKITKEILEKYNVDGIHIDDYFYPPDMAEDYLSYYKKNSKENIKSVTTLVKKMHNLVNKYGKVFGVSPQGNMKNNINSVFFDQETIISNGYVDYIMPQIYYGFENEALPFKKAVRMWKKLILSSKKKPPKLYIGLGAYKCGMEKDFYAKKGEKEWFLNSDILKRQVEFLKTSCNCNGYSFFAYNSLFMPQEGKIKVVNKEVENLLRFFERK